MIFMQKLRFSCFNPCGYRRSVGEAAISTWYVGGISFLENFVRLVYKKKVLED
jgi:hypothetical protein